MLRGGTLKLLYSGRRLPPSLKLRRTGRGDDKGGRISVCIMGNVYYNGAGRRDCF